jgi:hypothetical protein
VRSTPPPTRRAGTSLYLRQTLELMEWRGRGQRPFQCRRTRALGIIDCLFLANERIDHIWREWKRRRAARSKVSRLRTDAATLVMDAGES